MYTTQDYIDSLYNDRANIVKNLNEKGVEASADETFTQLAPKILNIGTGGGIYLKNTVEEMEAIDSPSEGDICLVYTKEQIHPLETSKFTKAIIRHTVTFETNEPGMSEFSSEDFNERLSVRVGTNYASVSYMTRDDYQDYSYDTTDGLTFTLNDYTEDVVLEFNSPLSNMMEYNASSAELLWIDDIDFSGLYEYKEGEWVYLDIDIKTAADQIFSPNKAYTSEGIVEGTTDPKTTYKIPIYIQADEPTDKNGIWIKPSYDDIYIARGKIVIMFTNENVGPNSNKAVQISTIPEGIGGYANEGNPVGGRSGIFDHTYYKFGKTTDESFTIDLLTGEKTNIPVCPYLQNLQSNSKRKVTQMCMDEVRNAIYLIAHDDLSWPLLACDYVLYKYDTETQTYEDKTSVLNIKERGYSANISWIHNNEMRIFVEVADRESECRIYNLPDLTLKEVVEQKGNSYLSTFRWIDDETIQNSGGSIFNAYTGEIISEVEGSLNESSVWIPALSTWGIQTGTGIGRSGCTGFYGDDFQSVIRYALNFYSSDDTPAVGPWPELVVPLEDKILFAPTTSGGPVYAIAYKDIKPVPTLDFNENTVITLQIAPTSFQEPYDWSDKGLDALALNIKNAFLYNENYYEGTPGTNAAKYVYLGDGTSWNLIASNIYTEEA